MCIPDCSEDPCGEDGCGGLCGLCGCDNQKVFVRGMTTKTEGYWQVFYTTEDFPKFTEDKSKLAYINVSNQYDTLEFDMGSKFTFEGVITGLRVDPPHGTQPFGIDSICLGVSEENCAYKWDFQGETIVPKTFFGWLLHDIVDTWTDGEKWGGSSVNGDPRFTYSLEYACDE